MALQVKSPTQARQKWQERTAGATKAYTDGVANPRRSWQTAASAANNNYVAAVTQAATAGKFAAGVNRAGDAKWQKGAREKGSQRWAPGVQAAGADYEGGVSKYFSVLQSLNLPERGMAGSAQNEQRSLEVQRALHTAKTAGG